MVNTLEKEEVVAILNLSAKFDRLRRLLEMLQRRQF